MVNKLDSTVLDFFSRNGNSQRIAEIYKVYKHIEDFASGILECSKDSLLKSNLNSMNMEVDAKRDFVKYYFPKTEKKVMLTVFFRDNLFSTNSAPHIHIAFEIQGNYKETLDKHEDDINSIISKSEYKNAGIKLATKTDEKNWRHLAGQKIEFTNIREKLPKIDEIVGEYINPSSSIIRMANEVIKALKSYNA